MFNFKIYLSPDDPCNNKEGLHLSSAIFYSRFIHSHLLSPMILNIIHLMDAGY